MLYRFFRLPVHLMKLEKADGQMMDSDRNNLAEIKRVELKDNRPVETTKDKDFEEQAIKDKVIHNGEITKVDKPDVNQVGLVKLPLL